MKTKRIIILDGPDASGKGSLSAHIQLMANGKCHVMHSNYNKELPKENHRRQHKLISKFAVRNFDKNYYTGNNIVILDRCYVSDMTYGQIGYGSHGTLEEKFNYLDKLFSILTSNPTVRVSFIYCRPDKTAFDKNAKDELLTNEENDKMQDIYDSLCLGLDFQELLAKHGISFYEYNFYTDPQYVLLDTDFLHFN